MKTSVCKNCKHGLFFYKKVWLHLEHIRKSDCGVITFTPSGRVLCIKQRNSNGSCGCQIPMPIKSEICKVKTK